MLMPSRSRARSRGEARFSIRFWLNWLLRRTQSPRHRILNTIDRRFTGGVGRDGAIASISCMCGVREQDETGSQLCNLLRWPVSAHCSCRLILLEFSFYLQPYRKFYTFFYYSLCHKILSNYEVFHSLFPICVVVFVEERCSICWVGLYRNVVGVVISHRMDRWIQKSLDSLLNTYSNTTFWL